MKLKKKIFWEIPSNTNSGILGFLEKIIRSHPLIYLITRNLIRYTNIFEEDANGVKYIKFKSKLNIMDIGASDGIAAKFFLKNLNVKKIICFEPNIKFLRKLKKLGNKKLINIKNFAIGPKNENVIVYYPVYSLLGKKFTLDTFCYYNKKVLEKQINLDFKFKKNIKIEKKILKIKKLKIKI
jgi:FkbM family methyltransferase